MTALPILTAEEQRVLGCLLEKEITVPGSYPLTLNALRIACNQSSSREPVVDYDERTVQDAARSLKERGLVRVTWMDYGKRTLKYVQTAVPELGLADDERAVVTVLLLRGPQAPGELKTRTDRLHAFADRADVEATLVRLAAREQPMVRRLERKPGQQDHRWIHLLGEVPDDAPAAAVDREQVLAAGADARDEAVSATYATIVDAYAETYGAAPAGRPFEQWALSRVAELAGGTPVADVGCGPGNMTRFLADEGADVVGFDAVPEMVAKARELHPDIGFEVADLRRLLRPATASGWGAIVAWYSLVHFAPSELGPVVGGLAGTLQPGGWLALALHAGAGVQHRDAWLGHEVTVDHVLHAPADVRKAVEAAGLVDVETYLVGAQGDQAHDRYYVLARRA